MDSGVSSPLFGRRCTVWHNHHPIVAASREEAFNPDCRTANGKQSLVSRRASKALQRLSLQRAVSQPDSWLGKVFKATLCSLRPQLTRSRWLTAVNRVPAWPTASPRFSCLSPNNKILPVPSQNSAMLFTQRCLRRASRQVAKMNVAMIDAARDIRNSTISLIASLSRLIISATHLLLSYQPA